MLNQPATEDVRFFRDVEIESWHWMRLPDFLIVWRHPEVANNLWGSLGKIDRAS